MREVEARFYWLWLTPHRNPASTTPTNNKGQVIGSSTRATREYRTSLEVGLTPSSLWSCTRDSHHLIPVIGYRIQGEGFLFPAHRTNSTVTDSQKQAQTHKYKR